MRAWILYDEKCGFCRWSLGKLLAWDSRDELRPVALSDPRARELLAELSERERIESWHLVTADGGVYSAGGAVAPLLGLLPRGRRLAALAAAFPEPVEAGYRLIARHRSTLGRILRVGERMSGRRSDSLGGGEEEKRCAPRS